MSDFILVHLFSFSQWMISFRKRHFSFPAIWLERRSFTLLRIFQINRSVSPFHDSSEAIASGESSFHDYRESARASRLRSAPCARRRVALARVEAQHVTCSVNRPTHRGQITIRCWIQVCVSTDAGDVAPGYIGSDSRPWD